MPTMGGYISWSYPPALTGGLVSRLSPDRSVLCRLQSLLTDLVFHSLLSI